MYNVHIKGEINMYRNHNCGELTIKNVGEKVTLAGWVQKIRNLGSMKFIDLRDEFGITQIVISSESSITDEDLKNVSTECVIQVVGNVVERSNKNDKIPTGEIEIDAEKVLLTELIFPLTMESNISLYIEASALITRIFILEARRSISLVFSI